MNFQDFKEFFLLSIVFLLLFGLLFGLKKLLLGRFPHEVDETLKKTSAFLITVTLFAMALPFIPIGIGCQPIFGKLGLIAFMFQVGVWLTLWIPRILQKAFKGHEDANTRSVLPILTLSLKVLVWVLIGLFVINNLGFDVTALVTGLGIGGIAIALAAQSVLSDFLASLSIILDRPFLHGDYVEVDGVVGCVEEIGLKTTKIKSQTGEQVIFGNAEILKTKIRNYSRMEERRVQFQTVLAIVNPEGRWEEVSSIMKEILQKMKGVRYDRATLASYTPSGLIYEVVFYSLDPLPAFWMERQQHFLSLLAKALKEKGLSLADTNLNVVLLKS